jgi:hypothetical protein
VSPNKAQLSLTQVTYLGLSISPTHKAITIDRKTLLASLPAPTTKAEILSFLSLTGYLRAWVPNFSLMAKPLYEASRGSIQEPLDPSQPVSGHFTSLLQALAQAPVLRLLDLTRPFFLYVSERRVCPRSFRTQHRALLCSSSTPLKIVRPHNQGVGPMPQGPSSCFSPNSRK